MEAGRKAGSNIVNTPANEAARDELARKIIANCDQCRLETLVDKYGAEMHRIHVRRKYFIDVTVDPWVVEVKTSPLTSLQFKNESGFIQKVVFDSAKEIGIKPSELAGGGHIHFDLERAFKGDVKHFRNFLVDSAHNSFLHRGVFGNDSSNAPTFAEMNRRQRSAFKKLIAEIDANPKKFTINKITKRMTEEVYYRNPRNWSPPEKYQNINLTRVPLKEDATVEIRGLNAQKSMEHFVMLTEMFERRIESLKGLPPIPLDFKLVDDGDLITRLWIYSHEVGIEFEKMKSFTIPFLQQFKPDGAKVEAYLRAKYPEEVALQMIDNFHNNVPVKKFTDRCLDFVRAIL
ncbi:MAG: hypothetical protein Fur0010_13520 [Bdellovibrio sp.]